MSSQTVYFTNPAVINNLQATTATQTSQITSMSGSISTLNTTTATQTSQITSLTTSLSQTQNGWGTPLLQQINSYRSSNGLAIDIQNNLVVGSSMDQTINFIDKESGNKVGVFQSFPKGQADDIAFSSSGASAWTNIIAETTVWGKTNNDSPIIDLLDGDRTINLPNGVNYNSQNRLFLCNYTPLYYWGTPGCIWELNVPGLTGPQLRYVVGLSQSANGFDFWNDVLYAPNPYNNTIMELTESTGCVTSIPVINGGTGYTTYPFITITSSGPLGTGAYAYAWMTNGGSINRIVMSNVGQQYYDGATVSMTGGGATATGAILGTPQVTNGFILTNLFTGPTSGPAASQTGVGFYACNFDKDGYLWAVNSFGQLIKYDRTTRVILKTIQVADEKCGLDNLTYDKSTHSMYMTSFAGELFEYRIDQDFVRNVKPKSGAPFGLCLSPDERTLFYCDHANIIAHYLPTNQSTILYQKNIGNKDQFGTPTQLPYVFYPRVSSTSPNVLYNNMYNWSNGRFNEFSLTGSYTGSYPNGSYSWLPYSIPYAYRSSNFGSTSNAAARNIVLQGSNSTISVDQILMTTGAFAGRFMALTNNTLLMNSTSSVSFATVTGPLASFTGSYGMTLGKDSQLYVSEFSSGNIYKVDTFAGSLTKTLCATGLKGPTHLSATPNNQLVVVEDLAKRISLVNPVNGKFTVIASGLPIGLPGYPVGPGGPKPQEGNLYCNTDNIFSPLGLVTIPGVGSMIQFTQPNYSKNPPIHPSDITVKSDGTIYYCGTETCNIYSIPYSAYSNITNA